MRGEIDRVVFLPDYSATARTLILIRVNRRKSASGPAHNDGADRDLLFFQNRATVVKKRRTSAGFRK